MVAASCCSGLIPKRRVVGSLFWPRPSHHDVMDQVNWWWKVWRTKCGVWGKDAQQSIRRATPESVNAPETSGVNWCTQQDWYLHRTGAIVPNGGLLGKTTTGVFFNNKSHLEKNRQSQTTLEKYVSNVASERANSRPARVLLAVLHRLILERQRCIFVSPWASRRFQRWRWEGNTSLLHSHWVNGNNGICALHHRGTVSSSFTQRAAAHWDIRKHANVTAVGQRNASRSPINTATSTLYSGRGGKKQKQRLRGYFHAHSGFTSFFLRYCFLYTLAF